MNKYYATPAKRNSIALKKYHGKFGSEKFNKVQLDKQFFVHKNEQVSPIKYGTKPSSEKVTGSLKIKAKINDTVAMKLDGVSLST